MELTRAQIAKLKKLMVSSARKGNLATSAVVMSNGEVIAESESLVNTNHDPTAHAERLLVAQVGKETGVTYPSDLVLITVCEPCLMCLSACSWAGYKTIAYIIPAGKYSDKIPWMSDSIKINKKELAANLNTPIELIHLSELEREFSEVFEIEMAALLNR